MAIILLVLSFVCALIATLLGFEIFNADGDPHIVGWLSLAFCLYVAYILVGAGLPLITRARRE